MLPFLVFTNHYLNIIPCRPWEWGCCLQWWV